jgi:DNA-binding NtrC family response regulator
MLALRPNLPVIMCTGFSEQISEEKAKQIGIRAFIMKPVVVNHLAKTIRRVLDSPPGESARGRPTRLTGRAACRRQPKRIRLRTEPHRMRMTN